MLRGTLKFLIVLWRGPLTAEVLQEPPKRVSRPVELHNVRKKAFGVKLFLLPDFRPRFSLTC